MTFKVDSYRKPLPNCFKTYKYCDNTCEYCTCKQTHFSSIGTCKYWVGEYTLNWSGWKVVHIHCYFPHLSLENVIFALWGHDGENNFFPLSFGWPTGYGGGGTTTNAASNYVHLANQDYDICIRRASGYCYICYSGLNTIAAMATFSLS